MECGRCLTADDEPMTFLGCGHAIHERCHAHVADEGAKCPVSASCGGDAFMLEDETEARALARLRKEYTESIGTSYEARERDLVNIVAEQCTVPECEHGTPFYYDGALHSYTLSRHCAGVQLLQRFRDGVLVASVKVRYCLSVSTKGPCISFKQTHMGKDGSLGGFKECTECADCALSDYHDAVDKWLLSSRTGLSLLNGSPLRNRAHKAWRERQQLAMEQKLKPVALAIECLELRESFRTANLGHLLQPLSFIPLARMAPSKCSNKVRQLYPLSGGAVIMLLGETTYLQAFDGVVHDLRLAHPDAWAINTEHMLSVFVGDKGYAFSLRDGARLEAPPNPNHYVWPHTVMDRPGRFYLVGTEWCY